VTVVVPARNEAATIETVVASCRPHCREVLVMDGNSADGTGRLAAGAGARVVTDRGRGKGEALRQAVGEIHTEIAVFIDADGSHVAEDIPKLIEPIRAGRADHVSASRLTGGSSELHGSFDECFRLMGSSFITALINRRFDVRLSESQNGFRAIRTSVLRELGLRARLTTIEQEMIMRTLALGYRMAEIPSHERRRMAGHSNISLWRHGPFYVLNLARHLCRPRYGRDVPRALGIRTSPSLVGFGPRDAAAVPEKKGQRS
jgi:dolichol-phosphate mannosyltransferase